MISQQRISTILLGVFALLFAILSARLNVPQLAFGVVGCAVISVILCVKGSLDEKTEVYLMWMLGLAFLLQSTLISNYLIGTDIHTEYYFFTNALDGWDASIPHSYNAAIGTTLIAPFLAKLGIPGYWIYKLIYPVLFAFVPVILYIIYRKEFGDKVAFLAGIFFITLPTYTLEMIGLPRQMLGELMLAAVLLLVIVRPIRLKYSIPLLCVVSALGYLFHYITGPAILMYLVGAIILLLFMKRRQFAIRWLVVVVLISGVIGFGYYSKVSSGVVLANLGMTSAYAVEKVTNGDLPDTPTIPGDSSGTDTTTSPNKIVQYFSRQEPLIRTALGLDFKEASASGKVFRIFQYLTQASLILGCVWLIKNRKKVSAEFMAFTITAIALIAACVILPRFSNIINASRFYHLALFLVSPLVVMGGLYIFRNLKLFAALLLIPYMLFTTGVIFEATQETDISAVNLPYSIALSNERIGFIGTYTDNDIAVRDYAIQQDYSMILADINGMLILSEVLDPFTYLYTPGHDFVTYPVNSTEQRWGFIPYPMSRLPTGNYTYLIYLTEWNTQN